MRAGGIVGWVIHGILGLLVGVILVVALFFDWRGGPAGEVILDASAIRYLLEIVLPVAVITTGAVWLWSRDQLWAPLAAVAADALLVLVNVVPW